MEKSIVRNWFPERKILNKIVADGKHTESL
jgi:hypothetical protein